VCRVDANFHLPGWKKLPWEAEIGRLVSNEERFKLGAKENSVFGLRLILRRYIPRNERSTM
jgi:hypothetical protein